MLALVEALSSLVKSSQQALSFIDINVGSLLPTQTEGRKFLL